MQFRGKIWNSSYSESESKYIKFLCNKTSKSHNSFGYPCLCKEQLLLSLKFRRKIVDVLLHRIYTMCILQIINVTGTDTSFNICSSSLRLYCLFAVPLAGTNYRQNSYLCRARARVQVLSNHDLNINIFNCNLNALTKA